MGLDRFRSEQPSERRDVAVKSGCRRLRRPFPPEGIDELVTSDDLVRSQHEERKERALLRTCRRELLFVRDDLERPEDPKLHLVSIVAPR
jgi:hypothetical protein